MGVSSKFDWSAYLELLEAEVATAIAETAKIAPRLIEEKIKAGQAIGGGVQKSNDTAYAAYKSKKGLPTTPLVLSGRLAAGYKKRQTGPATWEIYPEDHAEVLTDLKKRGYNVTGAPPELNEDLEKNLKEAAANIESKTSGFKR
jgi:hypothetical protein